MVLPPWFFPWHSKVFHINMVLLCFLSFYACFYMVSGPKSSPGRCFASCCMGVSKSDSRSTIKKRSTSIESASILFLSASSKSTLFAESRATHSFFFRKPALLAVSPTYIYLWFLNNVHRALLLVIAAQVTLVQFVVAILCIMLTEG